MSTARRLVGPLVAAACLWAVSGTSAKAQVPMVMGSWNVGIMGGASIPVGSAQDVYNAGWTAGAWVAYHSIGSGLSVRAMYSFQRFIGVLPSTTAKNVNGFSAEIVGQLPAIYVRPYLLAGAGGYHLSDSGTHFGWHAGGGIAFHVMNRTVLFEAKYLDMGQPFHVIPVTLGLVF